MHVTLQGAPDGSCRAGAGRSSRSTHARCVSSDHQGWRSLRCTDAQRLGDGRGRRCLLLRIVATAGALLAAGAVAAGGTTLAGNRAGHTTLRSDPFAGGDVVLTRVGNGAFLSFRDLPIGATRTGRLTIANEGSRAGELVLSAAVRPNPL